MGGHCQHAFAVGGLGNTVGGAFITGGDDDEATRCPDVVDRVLEGAGAGTFAPQTQIQHFGGMGVVGGPSHRQSRRPTHASSNVREVPATHPQHSHGQYFGPVGNTKHPRGVVANGRHHTRHPASVPAGVGGFAIVAGVCVPVAWIRGVRIASITIVGRAERCVGERIERNEVVARQDIGTQIGVCDMA